MCIKHCSTHKYTTDILLMVLFQDIDTIMYLKHHPSKIHIRNR